MGFFLLLLLLVTGSAAYYEYNWQEQSSDGFQSQIAAWETQLAHLKSENEKLSAERATLQRQVQAVTTFAPTAEQGAPAPSLPPAGGSVPLADLGTITTLSGKVYQNVKLMKIETTDIVISYPDGITQVPYALMTPNLQKRFGWDPQHAATVNAAMIRYQQQLQQASEAASASAPAPVPATTPANP